MNPFPRPVAVLTLAAGLALTAACGSSATSAGSGSTPSGGSGGAAAGSGATGSVVPTKGLHVGHTSIGDVLVDGRGHTVYLLTADHHGASTCNASCMGLWPPVAPTTAASGVKGALGHTTTPGGTKIATLKGVALYTYSGDGAAGDVNGEGISSFGGQWYAVSPSGTAIHASSGSTQSGGGYGY